MKYKKIVCIIFLLVSIILPNQVFAFCSSNTMQQYRGYARDVTIKYSFVNNDVDGGNFRLTFSNMNYNIYAKDRETGIVFQRQDETNDNEIMTTSTLFQGGKTRIIDYYTIDGMCDEDIVYTINLNIPKYNIYYNTEVCSGISNYEYCEQYIFTTLSNEEIKIRIDDYRESHEIGVVVEEDNNINYIIVGGIIILIIAIIVTVILLIRHKRKKELEWD